MTEESGNILEKLFVSIMMLNRNLDRSNSAWRVFFLGVIRGIGTVIGATIVAALILTILANVLQTIGLYPLLDRILGDSNLNSTVIQ